MEVTLIFSKEASLNSDGSFSASFAGCRQISHSKPCLKGSVILIVNYEDSEIGSKNFSIALFNNNGKKVDDLCEDTLELTDSFKSLYHILSLDKSLPDFGKYTLAVISDNMLLDRFDIAVTKN